MAFSAHMTAVLDVPQIRDRLLRASVADYHRYTEGQPTELLRGIVIEKMSRSPLHIFIAQKLHNILAGQIAPEFAVFLEGSITTPDSEPVPDVAVVAGDLDQYRSTHPATAELIVEVAIPSLEIDRVKGLIYAEAGVKECWIVCPEEKQVEIYRQPTAQGYAGRIVLSTPAVLESCGVAGRAGGFRRVVCVKCRKG